MYLMAVELSPAFFARKAAILYPFFLEINKVRFCSSTERQKDQNHKIYRDTNTITPAECTNYYYYYYLIDLYSD